MGLPSTNNPKVLSNNPTESQALQTYPNSSKSNPTLNSFNLMITKEPKSHPNQNSPTDNDYADDPWYCFYITNKSFEEQPVQKKNNNHYKQQWCNPLQADDTDFFGILNFLISLAAGRGLIETYSVLFVDEDLFWGLVLREGMRVGGLLECWWFLLLLLFDFFL